MFQNNIGKIFHPLQKLYDVTNLILVDSDIESWREILKDVQLESIHYIDIHEHKNKLLFPKNWYISTIPLSVKNGEIEYFHLTNPLLSGTHSHEYFLSLWKNISTKSVEQKEAISLETFLEKNNLENSTTMLVVDSFDGENIVQEVEQFNIPIVFFRIVKNEKENYDNLMGKKGYKCIEVYEDNHPEVIVVVYSIDYKQQRQNIQKELESEKSARQNIQKELESEKSARQNIQKELESEKSARQNIQKELESEKSARQNIQKELNKNIDELKVKVDDLIKRRDKLTIELNKTKGVIEQRDVIIQSFLNERDMKIPLEYLNTLNYETKINTITSYCIKQHDILEAIDTFILGNEMSDEEKFDLCCSFAVKVKDYGDRQQGISYINNAKYFFSNNEKRKIQYEKLIQLAVSLNALQLAVDLEMEYDAQFGLFSEDINKKLSEEYKKIRSISLKKQQHGHDLLIDYIEKNVKDKEGQGKVLVEIGTTRENIPGQGSTMQLAKLCKRKGIHFITVDMDPHNTRWANFISIKLDLNIETITKKGEDYLRNDIEEFDFVFLDAYDFVHGKHSELRQTRYEKNIGSRIDEEACHLMHLDCAKSVVKKLKKDGVICVDDTWKDENGNWMAKGTLAVPFLLENNFCIISKNNNACLFSKNNF
jgi:hypothetical protein